MNPTHALPAGDEESWDDLVRREKARLAATPPLAVFCGWCFVILTAAALAYGLWAINNSGQPLGSFDVTRAGREGAGAAPATFGPVQLAADMNPLRVVLHAGHAPVGSTRIRYTIALVGENGQRLWEQHGSLGSSDDDASIVWTTRSLAVFDVLQPGPHRFEVRFDDRSMDDLREARLDVRRNATSANPAWLWGLVGAAAASLIVSLVLGRTARARAVAGSAIGRAA
jgi:hypothetical protein